MAQPTQLTQSELDQILEQRKLSPFNRLKIYLKKLFLHIFFATLITVIGLWFLVAFTDFKLPFMYTVDKVEYQGKGTPTVTRTTRKKVVIDLRPRITDNGIVIKQGEKK